MKATKTSKRRAKPKSTAHTVRARVDDVLRILLDGAQPWDVVSYVSEKEAAGEPPWTVPPGGNPLCRRTVRRYCARAEKLIADSFGTDRDQLIREHVAKRRTLYARAVAKGDERAALACARDEAELLALYPAARHEVTGKDGGPLLTVAAVAQMSEAERMAHVRGLIAAARSRQAALPHYPTNGDAGEHADSGGGTDER
jgi:hypothetical protein